MSLTFTIPQPFHNQSSHPGYAPGLLVSLLIHGLLISGVVLSATAWRPPPDTPVLKVTLLPGGPPRHATGKDNPGSNAPTREGAPIQGSGTSTRETAIPGSEVPESVPLEKTFPEQTALPETHPVDSAILVPEPVAPPPASNASARVSSMDGRDPQIHPAPSLPLLTPRPRPRSAPAAALRPRGTVERDAAPSATSERQPEAPSRPAAEQVRKAALAAIAPETGQTGAGTESGMESLTGPETCPDQATGRSGGCNSAGTVNPGSSDSGLENGLWIPWGGNAPPPYPTEARHQGWEGMVLLELHLNANGLPDSVTVVHSSGHRTLDWAARRAAAQWRFEPSSPASARINPLLRIAILFRLQEGPQIQNS